MLTIEVYATKRGSYEPDGEGGERFEEYFAGLPNRDILFATIALVGRGEATFSQNSPQHVGKKQQQPNNVYTTAFEVST